MPRSSYAIPIGSNRRHGRHGGPGGVVAAAAAALASRLAPSGGRVLRVSPVIGTPALGPAGRAFANAAALTQDGTHRRYPRALAVVGLVGCLALAVAGPTGSLVAGAVVLVVAVLGRLVVVRRRP